MESLKKMVDKMYSLTPEEHMRITAEYEKKLEKEDREFHERMARAKPNQKPGPVPTYTGMGDYTKDEIAQMLGKDWEKQFNFSGKKVRK